MNVVAYPFYGYWEDIGTVKSFFEENLKLTRHVGGCACLRAVYCLPACSGGGGSCAFVTRASALWHTQPQHAHIPYHLLPACSDARPPIQ